MTEGRSWIHRLRVVGSVVICAAALSVVIELGFYLHRTTALCLMGLQVLAVLIAVGKAVHSVSAARVRGESMGHPIGRLAVILFLLIVSACSALRVESAFLPSTIDTLKFCVLYFAVMEVFPTSGGEVRLPLPPRMLAFLYARPALAIVLSFLGVILVGTALLMFPRATADGEGTPFVDALFTATSATCVTGLIVRDTPEYFSRFGHWVILGLIQTGGLGIMTIAAFFATGVGRRLRMRHLQVVQEAVAARSFAEVRSAVKAIILLTFTIEAIGALFLFTQWSHQERFVESPLFCSVFHSVSAFCNAGFSLFSNNLMDYWLNAPINLIITSLIILGGLGFTVLTNLFELLPVRSRKKRARLSLHSRLVLTATILLIMGGMAIFLAFEPTHVLRGLPWRDRLLPAYFQSVTTRTAGFNTVDIGSLSPPTQFGFMALMFIGGSPGSTAGGIKTTTMVLLFLTMLTAARGKGRVTCWGHTVPTETIWRAVGITVVASFALALCIMLLLAPASTIPGAPYTSFNDIMFEAFSAFGTVGLSTGLTPYLSILGKLLIILLMFLGRVGPLTLAIVFSGRPSSDLVKYPETHVMVG
ncbi:MAG: TrkH family potassium uptake protein [Planctomycetota bacterium]